LFFVPIIWASVTIAVPGDGWGLLVYICQLKVVNENTVTEYQESKVFGGQNDYQFALGESFSFLHFATGNMNEGSLPENNKYEYFKA